MTPPMEAGFATIEWTPEPGLSLLGQMHERIATHARDPLCACAAAFRQGERTIVIVSVDVCIIDNALVAATQELWSTRTGLASTTLLIHATHTHVAPAVTTLISATPDSGCVQHMQNAILDAAQQALDNLELVEVFAARGYLEQMGWNRRAMLADGSTRMYGHSELPDFIGMEGPRDGDLPLLWTRNGLGQITGVLVNFATHPNCLESECFYSADLPGAVRKYLGRLLDGNATIVYLTGAAGNTAPSTLDPYDASHPWRGEKGVERSGLYLAGEAAKVLASTLQPMHDPELDAKCVQLQIPLRAWPQPGEPTFPGLKANDYYSRAETDWPQRLQNESPFPLNINAVRIGEAIICTNPAELFVEFGLQIKESSPARVTFISELTDGWCGYVPTLKAFERGGYETLCAPSSQLAPEAGQQIVDATIVLATELFA